MSGLPTPASTQVTQGTNTGLVETTQVTRHATYYGTDVPDPIILQVRYSRSYSPITALTNFNGAQVENLLFRQSFHYIAGHIQVLRQMRGLPPPPEGHQGGSDDDPVKLLGVSSLTFELVLSILDLS